MPVHLITVVGTQPSVADGRLDTETFYTDLPDSSSMKAEKQPELRWQCLNCYKTYKGPDAEQKALDCCGSIVQGWWANYNKWGKQKWYGR